MILHIAPTPFFSDRGCHVRIAGIVGSLDSLGFQNTICTYHLGNDPIGLSVSRIAPINGHQKIDAGPSIYKPWADFKLALLTAKHIRKERPIALHAHLHEGVLIALLSRLLAFDFSLPIVGDMQGALVGELESYGFFKKVPFLKWPFNFLERFVMWSSTVVVCSSKHAYNKFSEEYPSAKDKLFLAQDGADVVGQVNDKELDSLRSKLQLDPEKLCVIYSGALIYSKGLEQLQELISACEADRDDLHFLIIGYPDEQLEAYINANNLNSLCTLVGRVPFDTLNNYLQIADAAVDTKRSDAGEGSGKILNYLANGLPVVAFDSVNNVKFLGSDTQLCQSVEDMRMQLILYKDDKPQRKYTSLKNSARFSEYFSWDVTAQQLVHAYQSIGASCQLSDSSITSNFAVKK